MAAFLTSCAPVINVNYREFTLATMDKIQHGMSPDEVEAVLGQPDLFFETTYGENTSREWKALVWKYYTGRDPKYKFVIRHRVNTFVFWNGINPPKLNHWDVEQVVANVDQ